MVISFFENNKNKKLCKFSVRYPEQKRCLLRRLWRRSTIPAPKIWFAGCSMDSVSHSLVSSDSAALCLKYLLLVTTTASDLPESIGRVKHRQATAALPSPPSSGQVLFV